MSEPIIRGQPDWGSSGERTFTGTGGSDLELGSRLNWPFSQVYDGEISFYDDFEASMLHWFVDSSTGSQAVFLDSRIANSGGRSVRLEAPSGDGEYAVLDRSFVMPSSAIVGVGFFAAPGALVGEFSLLMAARYNGFDVNFVLIYNFASGQVKIKIGGVETVIGTVDIPITVSGSFSWFELVVDTDNRQYRYLAVGSERFMLDQLPDYEAVSVYPDYIRVQIAYYNSGATVRSLNIDDLFIIRNVQLPTE